ncbi:MAG TPA: peptidoglycan DD-metalloendopeptidase family protein [Nitrospirota bacterium]|nr:peptidoglycan DD-metalloendopeptidase family protein [Nitrospirota bacterium]
MQYKRLVPAVLSFALLAGIALPTARAADAPPNRSKELERIQRELQEKQKDLKRVSRKERSVLTELDKIDRDIQSGAAELSEQELRLALAEHMQRDVETKSSELGGRLGEVKQRYALRLRALYKMRASGSPLFDTDSLDGMARQIKYLSLIAARDSRIIDEYQHTLRGLEEQQQTIIRNKSDILSRRQSVEAKKAELEAKRQRKAVILASVRREKSLSNQMVHELEEASANLWAMIRQEEHERRGTQGTGSPVRQGEGAGKSGSLPWPLEGAVLTHFGMQRHPQFGTMVFRRGIEIEAREGQPVHAVEAGQVAYADWYTGFGKLMILDHGGGFYSLYGNMSRLDCTKGDRVVKGQSIGLAGETGGVKGAKLYFEIRRNGEAQDPLRWLAKR